MDDKQLEEAMAESIGKSFNDSELEDIMNEIESLEKEFGEDADHSGTSESLALKVSKGNALQDVIDSEVMSAISPGNSIEVDASEAIFDGDIDPESLNDSEENAASASEVEEIEEAMNFSSEDECEDDSAAVGPEHSVEMMKGVINHSSRNDNVSAMPEVSKVESERGGMHLQASGEMNFNLTFCVDGHNAQLTVDSTGLSVSIRGVNLVINEEQGCTITMEHGVKFSVPLSNSEENGMKKAS